MTAMNSQMGWGQPQSLQQMFQQRKANNPQQGNNPLWMQPQHATRPPVPVQQPMGLPAVRPPQGQMGGAPPVQPPHATRPPVPVNQAVNQEDMNSMLTNQRPTRPPEAVGGMPPQQAGLQDNGAGGFGVYNPPPEQQNFQQPPAGQSLTSMFQGGPQRPGQSADQAAYYNEMAQLGMGGQQGGPQSPPMLGAPMRERPDAAQNYGRPTKQKQQGVNPFSRSPQPMW